MIKLTLKRVKRKIDKTNTVSELINTSITKQSKQ